MSQARITQLKSRLADLQPTYLEVIDDSHLHAGHAGAKDGASHFTVVIDSPLFEGLTTLQRHRLVKERVSDLMPYPIHALAIQTNLNV
ncbi:MAG TPA: BolA family transcriptional regulator [Candidatus Paenalcaligenes intestinipullorum]|uniref:BolA family transcriptional regulator n=1 Tax=Candidatus Paenalcaligenes intestinipullorum TaxID=2838718 RepID=A0A9D2U772_9BURK|nr:BolA family transcriptional regulator [Candidatus Paenalcaligenes intestinipullorum]